MAMKQNRVPSTQSRVKEVENHCYPQFGQQDQKTEKMRQLKKLQLNRILLFNLFLSLYSLHHYLISG